MNLKKNLIVSLVFSLAAVTVHAGVDDFAARFEKKRNDDVAIQIKDITPLAESGNVKAQHDLGYLYASASGIAQNMTIAAQWYQKAADQGHPNAQFNLGYLYENGQGVPKDLALAESWYKKSAKQGSVKAQTNLARMYVTDLGTPQDFPQAAYWFLKAAEQGDPSALNSLGYMYNVGQGVPQDYALAYALYNLAAVGHSMGAFAAANNRAHMMPRMTPKQIEAGGQLTIEISKPNNLTQAIDAYLKK